MFLLQRWNGSHFVRQSLRELGLSVQLGPHNEGVCPCPVPGHQDFVVIDTCGIQEINILFCGCAQAEPHRQQLMRVAWYPATVAYPRTACTFNTLKHFQLLSLQAKSTAYDFYRTIARETDNTGLNPPPVSLPSSVVIKVA